MGLMVPRPQQLRCGEARQRGVAGQRDQPFPANPASDLLALRRGALVVPPYGGAQRSTVLVEQREAVHLARQSDRHHVTFGGAGRPESRADGHARATPPGIRILLGPSGPWGLKGIGSDTLSSHVAGLINDKGSGSG